jgi:hypothetical protein
VYYTILLPGAFSYGKGRNKFAPLIIMGELRPKPRLSILVILPFFIGFNAFCFTLHISNINRQLHSVKDSIDSKKILKVVEIA